VSHMRWNEFCLLMLIQISTLGLLVEDFNQQIGSPLFQLEKYLDNPTKLLTKSPASTGLLVIMSI